MGDKRYTYLLCALIATYSLVYSLLAVERYDHLLTSIFDLGIFDQAVYLLSRDEAPFLSTRGLHVQADHFQPILWLVAPLYLIWSSPLTLLVFQTVVVAIGAYPVFRLAEHHGLAPKWSLLMSAAYLAQPAVTFLNRFEFHPVGIMMTALVFAVLYLETDSPVKYGLALVVALACTEAAGFTLIALAFSAFFVRNWRWSVATFLGGVCGLVVSRLSLHHYSNGRPSPYFALYTDYGNNEKEVLLHLLTEPINTICELSTFINWEYLFYLFSPLVFLPLLRPDRLVPMLPTLLGNLLSWRYSQHRIEYHYGAALAPFLIWAAVLGWVFLSERKVPEKLLGALLLLALSLATFFGPLGPNHGAFLVEEEADLSSLSGKISATESLTADCALGSHFSQRNELYLFPNPFLPAAWGNCSSPLFEQANAEYSPFTRGAVRRGLENSHVQTILLAKPDWRSDFPLRAGDSEFCRHQTLRSSRYQLVEESEFTYLLRRAKN